VDFLNSLDLASFIDHTLLKPDATEDGIKLLCEEAKQYNFASVCVNPVNVPLAKELLKGSKVMVCTVVGFPLGANSKETKAFETMQAVAAGADEIDMVINVGALKLNDLDKVRDDIKAVVNAAYGKTVKVIIETSLLTDEEKYFACKMAKDAGAAFVKTSTGFSGGGATVKDITLMRGAVGENLGVKASGGVKTAEFAKQLIEAGATRIGTSAGISIVQDKESKNDY